MTFENIIHSDKPALVDFFAEWCGPCKTMSPILKKVKDEVKDSATIIKIDVDKNNALAAKYKVQGVPTLILFKNGEIVWRQSGVVQPNQLISIINNNIK